MQYGYTMDLCDLVDENYQLTVRRNESSREQGLLSVPFDSWKTVNISCKSNINLFERKPMPSKPEHAAWLQTLGFSLLRFYVNETICVIGYIRFYERWKSSALFGRFSR